MVAVLAFVLNQHAQLRRELRQAELVRVNSQLRELYGPLNALVDVNERIWEAIRETSLPPQPERHAGSGSDDWRRWRDQALIPANREMRNLIIGHADLLVGEHVPEPLRDFCAHVASFDVVLAGQAAGTYQPALLRHPGAEYVRHVRESFALLKRKQQELLKTTAHASSLDLPAKPQSLEPPDTAAP